MSSRSPAVATESVIVSQTCASSFLGDASCAIVQRVVVRGGTGGKVAFLPEFRLALECCRHSFRGAAAGPVTVPADLDWAKFLRLARFHRIEGLAWNALSGCAMPQEMRACLSDAASTVAVQSLHRAAECRQLIARFEAAAIPLLFLKGLTLGALAYGNPALKSAIDIDLLIDPQHLRRAAELLRQSGYRLVAPRDSNNDETLLRWHRDWKESVWAKDVPPIQIDLHTRTADNPHLIPHIDVHSPQQLVEVASGIRLPTLADEHLFAYLTVHGASSAWFRIKWISDFAGLVHGRMTDEIEQLYRRSQRLGAGRAAGQALLLADALFGTLERVPTLRDELRRDRSSRWLCDASLRLLTGQLNEPTETRWGTTTIHWSQFLLLPGIRFKLSELSRQASRFAARGS